MRTTLTIDDEVYKAARSLAEAKQATLGAIISDLAKRGLAAGPRIETKRIFPVFSVSPDSAPITLEDVKRVEDEI